MARDILDLVRDPGTTPEEHKVAAPIVGNQLASSMAEGASDFKETFDLDSYFKDNGIEFLGKDPSDPYKVMVKDKAGEQYPINVKQLMQDEGVPDPSKAFIKYNDPSTALQVSPVTSGDRQRLSLGNEAGNMAYLKDRFKDVAYSNENGFSVKKDGMWHAIDPSLLGKGSAWDKTKAAVQHGFGLINNPDLEGDLAELGPEAINAVATTTGAAIGTGILPGVGTVAGAGVGGAVSGTIRTSLGRLVGTYDASPAEQLMDIGTEGLISAAGETIAIGAKPGVDAAIKGAKNIAKHATESGKDRLASLFGEQTKVGQVAMRTFIDHAQEVGGNVKTYLNKAGQNVANAIENVAGDKVKAVRLLVEDYAKEIPNWYGRTLEKELAGAPEAKNFRVVPQEMANSVFSTLEELGFGTTQKTGKEGFRFFTNAEWGTNLEAGAYTRRLAESEKQALQPVIDFIKDFSKIKELKGKAGVQGLKNLEKNLNDLTRSAFDSENQGYKELIAKVTSAFRQSSTEQFEKQGLGEVNSKLAAIYQIHGDNLNMARQVLKSESRAETLTNQFTSKPGKNATAKNLRKAMTDVLGARGEAGSHRISVLHATEKFLPRTPSLGVGKILKDTGYGAIAGGAVGRMVGMETAGAAIGAGLGFTTSAASQAARSPWLVRNSIDFSQRGLDFLKGLGPKQMAAFISSDAAQMTFLRSLSNAYGMESQTRNQLLQSAGLPGDQDGQGQQGQ